MPKRTALLATCGLAALVATLPAAGQAENATRSRTLFQLALDLDKDGMTDLASLVLLNPLGDPDEASLDGEPFLLTDGETVDLEIRLGKAGKPADPSQPADIRKTAIIDTARRSWVVPLETDDSGRLVVASASGPGSSQDIEQSMTIASISGRWIVTGFSEFWEVSTSEGDNVETDIGGCTIDYLAGTATINTSLEDTEPLAGVFKPVTLADWTDAMRPPACKY